MSYIYSSFTSTAPQFSNIIPESPISFALSTLYLYTLSQHSHTTVSSLPVLYLMTYSCKISYFLKFTIFPIQQLINPYICIYYSINI